MAVTAVRRKPGSRRGPVRDQSGNVSYYDVWLAVTDSYNDDGRKVMADAGLPQYNAAYDQDASAVVTEIDPQQVGHDNVWEINYTYRQIAPHPGKPGTPQTPQMAAEAKPQRTRTSRPYLTHRLQDLDGKGFKNSAGDPFDPPPGMFVYHPIYTFRWAAVALDEPLADGAENCINEDAITIGRATYPQHTAKINRIDATEMFAANGEPYQQIVIELEINPEKWHPFQVVDEGFRHKKDGVDGLFLDRDDSGVLTGRKVWLNGNGFRLERSFKKPETIDFKTHKAINFAALGIPLH